MRNRLFLWPEEEIFVASYSNEEDKCNVWQTVIFLAISSYYCVVLARFWVCDGEILLLSQPRQVQITPLPVPLQSLDPTPHPCIFRGLAFC